MHSSYLVCSREQWLPYMNIGIKLRYSYRWRICCLYEQILGRTVPLTVGSSSKPAVRSWHIIAETRVNLHRT